MVLRWRRVHDRPASTITRLATRTVASSVVVASLVCGVTMRSAAARGMALPASAQHDAFCGALRAQVREESVLTKTAHARPDWRELRSQTVAFLRASQDNYAVMAAQSTGRLRDDLEAA